MTPRRQHRFCRTRPIAVILFVAAVLGLAACGTSRATVDRLAAGGSIDDRAPVTAHAQIQIAAPLTQVWELLVNARAWPEWQKDIQNVAVAAPLANGTQFVWTTGGTQIHSQVRRCEPPHLLSWTGQAWTAKAIHVWELKAESGDRTLVTIKESMDGLSCPRYIPPISSRIQAGGGSRL